MFRESTRNSSRGRPAPWAGFEEFLTEPEPLRPREPSRGIMAYLPVVGKSGETDYESLLKDHGDEIAAGGVRISPEYDIGNFCCVLFCIRPLAPANHAH